MTGYVIGAQVVFPVTIILVLCWSVWYSRTHRSFRERLGDGRPRRTGSPGWGWSFILLSIGAGICVMGCYLIVQQFCFMLNASPIVEARIVNYTYFYTRHDTHYSPVVSFKTREGKHLTATTLNSLAEAPRIGLVTKVRYDIRDPNQVELVVSEDNWFGQILLVTFGTFLLSVAVGFSPPFERIRASRRAKQTTVNAARPQSEE